MKILLVTWYFPPCSTMGALRLGKFAKYLAGQGHDVRIVCARDLPFGQDLPVEVDIERVFYSRWRDVNWFPAAVQALRVRLRNRRTPSGAAGAAPAAAPASDAAQKSGGLFSRALAIYKHLTNMPDGMIGWLLPALKAGREATRNWSPDIVFASAPPFTTLIAGRMIAKRCKAPLVIEYRDRWIEDPYFDVPAARLCLERRIEEWCARPARHLVTVSEPWARDYEARWGKPVTVAYNGFDPDDFRILDSAGVDTGGKLRIVYTGILYTDRRDPSPLFEALSRSPALRDAVSVDFYGASPEMLAEMIGRYGLEGVVGVHPRVTFEESLRLQRSADVLLLLQWNDPLEAGNVPGKLFEYIAARRPVLGIGYEGGVPARILAERDAGRVMNDPDEIAAFLSALVERKRGAGSIDLLPEATTAGLSRPEQYAGIEDAFRRVLG